MPCNKTEIFLDLVNEFEKEENCLKKYKFCWKNEKGIFKQGCALNEKKVGFMCVPLCYEELNENLLQEIEKDEKYCHEEMIELGVPFFDL